MALVPAFGRNLSQKKKKEGKTEGVTSQHQEKGKLDYVSWYNQISKQTDMAIKQMNVEWFALIGFYNIR